MGNFKLRSKGNTATSGAPCRCRRGGDREKDDARHTVEVLFRCARLQPGYAGDDHCGGPTKGTWIRVAWNFQSVRYSSVGGGGEKKTPERKGSVKRQRVRYEIVA
jgi:hypothetical protein